MESMTKEEIEEIERMMENTEHIRKAREKGDPNKIIIGGYVNTIYKSSKNKKRVFRNRKNLRMLAEKLVKESTERIKKNNRKIIENK